MTPGISALVRARNEQDWIGYALDSIRWCDEIVIVLNCCDDNTPQIVENFRSRYPEKTIVQEWPFEIHPMGPGHDDCPTDDPHSSAAFYNFTQSLATRTHALKWDGDTIAMDWFGDRVRELMAQGHNRIKIFGTDLSEDIRFIGNHPVCPSNGIYQIAPGVGYVQGQMTQSLRGIPPHTAEIHDCFIHTKWAKPLESATVQWPENWRDIPHFQNIYQRRVPVAPYTGEYPTSVRRLMETATC